MNCVEWETRVALHAGGDLTGAEATAVERHLGECSACQVLWSGVRESLAVLQAAHAELPAAADFTAVRARVRARTGAEGAALGKAGLDFRASPRRRCCWCWRFGRRGVVVPEAPRSAGAIPPAPVVRAPVRQAAAARCTRHTAGAA